MNKNIHIVATFKSNGTAIPIFNHEIGYLDHLSIEQLEARLANLEETAAKAKASLEAGTSPLSDAPHMVGGQWRYASRAEESLNLCRRAWAATKAAIQIRKAA